MNETEFCKNLLTNYEANKALGSELYCLFKEKSILLHKRSIPISFTGINVYVIFLLDDFLAFIHFYITSNFVK